MRIEACELKNVVFGSNFASFVKKFKIIFYAYAGMDLHIIRLNIPVHGEESLYPLQMRMLMVLQSG